MSRHIIYAISKIGIMAAIIMACLFSPSAYAQDTVKLSEEITIVEGSVPRPHENIIGCKFAPRCEFCTEKCLNEKPPTILKSNGTGRIKCWKYIKD